MASPSYAILKMVQTLNIEHQQYIDDDTDTTRKPAKILFSCNFKYFSFFCVLQLNASKLRTTIENKAEEKE